MDLDQLKPGAEVRALSTGRRMVVRSVHGDTLVCAWFDGRRNHEVRIRRDAVRASSATADDRIVTHG